jgi:hypothetical protein
MANTLVGSELRKGSGFARKGQGFQLIFGETWSFRVKTDQVTGDRLSILYDTPGLPYAGLLYGPLGLICDEVSCEREEKHALYWNVTARFQTGTEEQKQSQQSPGSPDPLTWIPVFKVDSFTTKERVITQDRSTPAKYAKNSAGTPFDVPLVEKRTLCQFSFVQFEDPSLKLKAIMDRNDCVNTAALSAAGQTFAARTLLVDVCEAELGSYAGFQAWRVKYRMTYDPDTHDEKRANIGPYFKDAGDGGKLKRYMDDTKMFGIIGYLDPATGDKTTSENDLVFQVKKPISFSWVRT